MRIVLTLACLLLFAGSAFCAQYVDLETNRGTIRIELFEEKAPETVRNFLAYAEAGHYDGTIFHRVIENFMIQGGGFTEDLVQKKTGEPIRNEAHNGLKNRRGTVAMARTPVVDSATSQFFINLRDNPSLDHRGTDSARYGYAVFGRVVSGMDVVEVIGKLRTSMKKGHQDVPVDPVIILRVERVKE